LGDEALGLSSGIINKEPTFFCFATKSKLKASYASRERNDMGVLRWD
jgi:hypothetical protein